ncbi:unnamed protein product [Schistocephalus solidus]|uniref:Transmembrane protein 170B n=1 Tax=Schistocephalus solidus TaxID=70667 RepID=A0A3P7CE84_SCHSO|nr:unnamed protein product [Schistocephalus solidus]
MWAASCNAVIYGIATVIAFVNLRVHKRARVYFPLVIVILGLISTFTVVLITCLVIAGVFHSMGLPFGEWHAVVCGVLQSLLMFVFSISRLPATL